MRSVFNLFKKIGKFFKALKNVQFQFAQFIHTLIGSCAFILKTPFIIFVTSFSALHGTISFLHFRSAMYGSSSSDNSGSSRSASKKPGNSCCNKKWQWHRIYSFKFGYFTFTTILTNIKFTKNGTYLFMWSYVQAQAFLIPYNLDSLFLNIRHSLKSL